MLQSSGPRSEGWGRDRALDFFFLVIGRVRLSRRYSLLEGAYTLGAEKKMYLPHQRFKSENFVRSFVRMCVRSIPVDWSIAVGHVEAYYHLELGYYIIVFVFARRALTLVHFII